MRRGTLIPRGLIFLYRHSFATVFGGQCRFMPSCSAYADEAIRIHGPLKGTALALKRVCCCHPWGKAGFDPVPPHVK
jgi:putative membrane protein insertion efficiency factor